MNNIFDITGKKAIVTGGNKGLGRGITEGLLEAGAEVAILASSASVFSVVNELSEKGYRVFGVQCDLNDRSGTEKGFESAVQQLGGLDILVNNAGIQRRNKCEDFSLDDWDDVLRVNLTSVFATCQLAGRHMLIQGSGKIINMASLLSFFGGFTVPAYAAAKGGIAQLTKALSNEWASKGINVNAIAPGYMDTEMNVNLVNDPKRYVEITSRIPMARWGTPEDMKGIVVFLASPASDYLSGAIIPVDGGYLGK